MNDYAPTISWAWWLACAMWYIAGRAHQWMIDNPRHDKKKEETKTWKK